jgi:branched-subunit amino acid transport protein
MAPSLILAVAVLAAGTYAFRIGGVLLRERLRLPEPVREALPLAAVALLAALAATAALTQGGGFAGVARPVGVLAGTLAAWRKLPFIAVVAIAAVTTALLRLAGVP